MPEDRRRTLLEGLSHELRAPLQTLLGHIDLLAGGNFGPLNDDQKKAVRSVQRSAEKILTVAEDVLQVARIEAGAATPRVEDVPLDALLAREVEDARAAAEAKGLRLRLACPAGLAVRTDAAKLARIVANLLGNAIKYTSEGEVAVRVEGKTIEVSDTGAGIPEEEQDAIFDAYVRLDQGEPGTGLGLAIVRGLVDVLGARLSLDSAVGRGTTVRVELA